MDAHSFEYCSLNYLNQWLSHDRVYCKALAEGDESEKLSALKKAGSFYSVARNLPLRFEKITDSPRYKPVLKIIDALEPKQFQHDPVSEIIRVQESISKEYGGNDVLSLTTKFLWLKIKDPIIIFDSRAQNALGTKNKSFQFYYETWRMEFKKIQSLIADACAKLPEMNKYAIDQALAKKDIAEISSQVWFQERVYDIYLWSKGRPS